MCSDSRLLLQFDKMKAGAKLIFSNDRYVLNPVQAICPVCYESASIINATFRRKT